MTQEDQLPDTPILVPNPSDVTPHASIVVPVNAQADLATVSGLLSDLRRYAGAYTFETILVINNFEPDTPPDEIEAFEASGVRVVAVPQVWTKGEAVCFSARVPGIRAALSECCILFDADCRVLDPSKLIDWYVHTLANGATAAYTHVDFYDVDPAASVRAKIFLHHLARWVKRVLLRIPTTRGSNYAVRRTAFLDLYDQKLLADDLNVGPSVKAGGGQVAYSGARALRTETSGRNYGPGWRKIYRYMRYRLLYNIHVLPVRANAERAKRKNFHATKLR